MKTFKLILIAALGLFSLNSSAQTFAKDSKVLSFHFGLGGSSFKPGGLKTAIPPVMVAYEHGITDQIGVGGMLAYTSSKLDFFGGTWKYSYTLIGLNGNYHLNEYIQVENLDVYGGLTLGYVKGNLKFDGSPKPPITPDAGGGVFWGIRAGGRYYFTDKLAASAELGYGLSNLNLGIAYKL